MASGGHEWMVWLVVLQALLLGGIVATLLWRWQKSLQQADHLVRQSRQSQQRYADLARSVPGAVFELQRAGAAGEWQLCYLSPKFGALFGRQPDTLPAWLALLSEPARQALLALLAKPEEQGELEGGMADSDEPWWRLLWTYQAANGAEAESMSGVVLDISLQRQQGSQLTQALQRLQLATRVAGLGTWDWDMQRNTVGWDAGMYPLYGLAPGQFNGTPAQWATLLHPDDLERCSQQFQQALQNHLDFQQDFRIVRPDGQERCLHGFSRFDYSKDGTALRALGVSIDVTPQRQALAALQVSESRFAQAEQATRASEERLDLVIQSAGIGLWDWDIATGQISFREQCGRLLAYPDNHFAPTVAAWQALLHPGDREPMRQALRRHLNQESPIFRLECRVRMANGQYRWLLEAGRVVQRDEAGKALRMLGVMIDIDEHKQYETSLRQAKDLAVAASEAKSSFLANMSHEIRTPLNAVIGFTSLLLDSPLAAQQRDFVDSIRASGDALLTLINDILDFSKIEAGKLELETIEFDPRHTLEETLDIVAEKAQHKAIDLACLVDPSVPMRIKGDPGRLRQVLLNLLNNAVKFTDRGDVVVRAKAEALAGSLFEPGSPVRLRIEVSDSGIGIDDDVLAKLFTPFTQADVSTTRRYGGTGLGLSICKRLVEAMGGSIGVRSQLGQGARFYFDIQAQVCAREPVSRLLPMKLSGKQVLVVDDAPVNRELLALQLSVLDLQARCVGSAAEALAALDAATVPFELAILDMQMPETDGLMLAEAIRQRPRWAQLPLVLLTSLGFVGQAAEVRAARFAAYLSKPIRQAALLGCIQEVFKLAAQPGPHPMVTVHTLAERLAAAKPRVLLAEDNPVNQKVAVLMLEKLGCRIDVAGNGLEAIAAVRQFHYDLVFMDCQMPEMDGFAATQAIRALGGWHATLPIVALTANVFRADQERCLQAGMSDFIAKPVSAAALQTVLGKWLPLPQLAVESGVSVTAAQAPELPLGSDAQNAGEPEGGAAVEHELQAIRLALQELARNVGMDMSGELIPLFRDTVLQCLADLQREIAVGDSVAAGRTAHRLKGTALQIGSPALAAQALQLELLGQDGDLAALAAGFPALQGLAEGVLQRLSS